MADRAADAPARHAVRDLPPVLLVRAARPRQTVATAAAFALAAGLAGRPTREVALVAGTVVVGQTVLAWDNDLVDERTDRAEHRCEKALVAGLDRGTLWFALACAVLLVVPLPLSSGIVAGLCYLVSLVVGLVGNRLLRSSRLSWLPWAVSFALYPAFLSYGGWGGAANGDPPTIAVTVASAMLGVGVHVLVSLTGLVRDNEAGRRHFPLRLALAVGAPRLLLLTLVYCALVVGLMVVVATSAGLHQ